MLMRCLLLLTVLTAPSSGGETSSCQGDACLTEARVLMEQVLPGQGPADRDRALLERGCEQGHASTCLELGYFHLFGDHLALDLPTAEREAATCLARAPFARACVLGSLEGCTREGVLAGSEQCGGRDIPVARDRLTRACEAEHARGCFDLGVLHHYGLGTPADADRAMELYRRACALNPPTASEEHDPGLVRRCGRLRTSYAEDSRWL